MTAPWVAACRIVLGVTGGDRPAEATRLEGAGDLVIRAGRLESVVHDRPADGRARAEALADEARLAGEPAAEVMACRLAAWAARELYQHDAAQALLGRARRVARRHGLDRLLGQVMVTWSAVHLELGNGRAAGRDLVAAREAFAPAVPVELVFAEGLVAQKLGYVADAVAAYRHVLADPASDAAVRFKAANNLGEVLAEAGRLDEAEAALADAATFAEGSSVFGAIVAANRGIVAVQRGHLASAEDHFARTERLAAQAGIPLVEFRLEEVRSYRAAGLWPEAAARLEVVVADLGAPGAALLLADALLVLAEAALRCGDAPRALATATEAARRFGTQRRWVDRAAALVVAQEATFDLDGTGPPATSADTRALRRAAEVLRQRGEQERAVAAWLLVGRIAAATGRPERARQAWAVAGDLARHGPVLVRVQGHLARALAARGPAERRRACAAGLHQLDAYREGVVSIELRARLAGHGRELSDLALRSLEPGGRSRQLFRWLEAGRGVGQITTEPTNLDGAVADDLAALRRIAGPGLAGTADSATDRRRLVQQRRLENRIRRRTWSDAAPGRARGGVPVDAVVERARPGLLVSYGVVGSRLVAVAAGQAGIRRVPVGPVAPALDAARRLQFAARRLPRPGPAGPAAADAARHALAELDAALVAPLAPHLRSLDEDADVVVIPPPGLANVPWGAVGGLASHPVRVASSARLWLDSAGGAPTPAGAGPRAVLVAGPRLQGADREVVALGRRRPSAEVLDSAQATGDAVRAALAGADLAHLACHGRLRADAPLLSALELADGPFTVYDLESVSPLPAVVVLAACDAGLLVDGSDGAADTLGFIAALLQRGTRAVVAATIPVPDLDVTPMLVDLHDHLLAGATTSQALWRARPPQDGASPVQLATALAFTCFGGG